MSLAKNLLAALARIDRPAQFCTRGRLPAALPGLEVAGVGPIALPLDKSQAVKLRKQAHPAPYGKGTETLVDTKVRKVWELDAEQVVLANPDWARALEEALRSVEAELGLPTERLAAHLYKLLLYEKGSFFLPHRDGEKLDRMVATLVIVLPSQHAGGELVVRHEGREEIIDFGPDSRFHTQYAAFYADCEHEVRRVTSGHRLALTYNLELAKGKGNLAAPQSRPHVEEIARLLRKQRRLGPVRPAAASDAARGGFGQARQDQPASKLAVLLEHKYTEAGLSPDALKGLDRARADVLFAASREADWDAHLALVEYWVSGSADASYDYGYRDRRRRSWEYEDEDVGNGPGDHHTMGDVFDWSRQANNFLRPDGARAPIRSLPLSEEEIVSPTPFGEGEPDREEFEGYTGNAGMTLDHWYHAAAVLLWPAESRFEVLCEGGTENAVAGLETLVAQWRKAPAENRSGLEEECRAFARRIIACWPERGADYHRRADERQPDALLALLAELGDPALIGEWLRGVMARDVTIEPGPTLGQACKQHGWRTFGDDLRLAFLGPTHAPLDLRARLVAEWSQQPDRDATGRDVCAELASGLVRIVEQGDPQAPRDLWQPRERTLGDALPPLLQALLSLEAEEPLERLVSCVLERPRVFPLTETQVPVLAGLAPWLRQHVRRRFPALDRWLLALRGELSNRTANPPQPPTDFRRAADCGCSCRHCQELARFLADPQAPTLRLRLAEDGRRHLHGVIERAKLDTTHVTERVGRPYTLVCTKTTGAFDRAVAAHRVDVEQLALVDELLAWREGL